MIASNRRLHWVLALSLILVPAAIGMSRHWAIGTLLRTSGVSTIRPAAEPDRNCSLNMCTQEVAFSFSSGRDNADSAFGYYGAFADSWVRIDGRSYDEIKERADLRLSWFQFKTYRLPDKTGPMQGAWNVAVISASPVGTRKLGMSEQKIFVGNIAALENIKRLFEFYNIHLYLLAALLLCGMQLFIASSRVNGPAKNSGSALPFAFTLAALVSYSHYFDPILIGLGAPVSFIEGLARIFWGPAIFSHLFTRRLRGGAIFLYWACVIPGLLESPMKDFFFAGLYKWVVTVTSLVSIGAIFRQWRHLSLLSPISLLLMSDTLVIHGIMPLFGGLYLSPLGLFALPAVKNLPALLSILNHHYFWHQKNSLSAELNKLRLASPASANPEWKDLLHRMAQQLAKATGAEKVSICYLGLDSPLIVGINSGKRIEFQDGKLPPVFARVIQTDEAVWWTDESIFSKGLSGAGFQRKDHYKSQIATVLPIRVASEVYGAVSLTDFSNSRLISEDADLRTYLEEVILSYRDLLSAQLVRRKEVSSASNEKISANIVANFSEKAPFAGNPRDAASLFLEYLIQEIPGMGMFFEYHPGTERLELVSTVGMSPELSALWNGIPFRARPTNRLSPFAISINERRGIYINDIRVYFGLLAAPSVDVLEASQVRGFVSVPVCIGDKILGLICLLEQPGHESLASDTPRILAIPCNYLAYHLEQLRATHRVSEAERVVGRFADPALIRALGASSTDLPILAGETFSGAILVQDMRGSTSASRRENDPAALAAKLSRVYGVAGKLANRYGGTFEKGNGDGLITTLKAEPGNGEALTLCMHYLDEVFKEAHELLQIKETIVIAHRGTLFRGVMGHLQRIAWDTCGRDLVDAFAIEKAAKQIPEIVLAMSSEFVSAEPLETREAISRCTSRTILIPDLAGEVHLFDRASIVELKRYLLSEKLAA